MRSILLASILLGTASLAGCVGDFNVRQTEPLRVQLEDSRTANVTQGEDDEREFVIVADDDTDSATVHVRMEKNTPGPAHVLVIVRDEDGTEIERHVVCLDHDGDGDLRVDLRDRADNVVVVTQVIQGDVNINVRVTTNVTVTPPATPPPVGDDNVTDDNVTDDNVTDDDGLGDDFLGNDTDDNATDENLTDNLTGNETGNDTDDGLFDFE